MWDIIKYVSSGFTLAAFLAAVVAAVLKNWIGHKERLISSAREADRAQLVSDALEFFPVDSIGLTKEQQTEIALAQIRGKAALWKTGAIVLVLGGALAAVVAGVAIWKSDKAHKEEYIKMNAPIHKANMQAVEKASSANPANRDQLNDGKTKLTNLANEQKQAVLDGEWLRAGELRNDYKIELDKVRQIAPKIEVQELIYVPDLKKPDVAERNPESGEGA
jgi:ribosomal protein L24